MLTSGLSPAGNYNKSVNVWSLARAPEQLLSSKAPIPAVYRLASKTTDTALSCVAAVHYDAIKHIDLKARQVVGVTGYTNTKPSVDIAVVVVEPWLQS